MRSSAATTLKWAWILGVGILAGWLLYRARSDVAEMLRRTSPTLLLATAGAMVGAKLLLAENARIAASRAGIELGFATAARLYNLSQLGKYIPGSVWQFVGRAAAYRHRGASYTSIRDALLVESLWIVAGAALAGTLLAGPALLHLAEPWLQEAQLAWGVGMAVAGLIAVLVVALRWREAAIRYLHLALPSARVVVGQVGIWCLLGLAFWLLVRACGMHVPLVFAAGLFAFAYALGFLVLFAPAGLGVRDAVLTLGLLPYVPAGEAVAVTVLARALYLLVDVGLALGQEPLFALASSRRPPRSL